MRGYHNNNTSNHNVIFVIFSLVFPAFIECPIFIYIQSKKIRFKNVLNCVFLNNLELFVICFWFQEKPKENIESVIVNRLTEAIKNGIQVLDTKFETIEVSASDSDDDEDNSPHRWVLIQTKDRIDIVL